MQNNKLSLSVKKKNKWKGFKDQKPECDGRNSEKKGQKNVKKKTWNWVRVGGSEV